MVAIGPVVIRLARLTVAGVPLGEALVAYCEACDLPAEISDEAGHLFAWAIAHASDAH